MNVERLKEIVKQGPPPEPNSERQGDLLKAYLDQVDLFVKENGDQPPNPVEAVCILAHTIDRLNWLESMKQFNKMKHTVDMLDRRVQLVP